MTNAHGSCAEYEVELSALLDGELDTPREAALHAHLESCPSCSRRARALRRADEALRALPGRDAPADLRTRLQARIDREPEVTAGGQAPGRGAAVARLPRRRSRSLARPPALIALAGAAALALHLMTAPGERPVPATEPSDYRLATATDLEGASPDELELALELETVEDMEVIANLELLELLVALGEGAS